MTDRERRTVSLALVILRRAAKTLGPSVRSEAVQLALRVMLPHVDRLTLMTFWTVTDNPNPMQRIIQLGPLMESIEVSAKQAGHDLPG